MGRNLFNVVSESCGIASRDSSPFGESIKIKDSVGEALHVNDCNEHRGERDEESRDDHVRHFQHSGRENNG